MKLKLFIKRFLAWIGAAAMLLSVTGCAKRADASVIAKTNTEEIITLATAAESATAASDTTATLAERIGAPELLAWENVSADGKLTVSIDAPVIVPENDLPIVRVEPAQFSQETVDRFYTGLVGERPMVETIYQRTRAELESLLEYYRGVLAGETSATVDKDFAADYIKDFEAQLNTAPEAIEPVPATSALKRIPIPTDGKRVLYYDGLDLMSEDRKYFFFVRNDRDNTEPIAWDDVDEDGNVTGGTVLEVSRNASMSYNVMADGPHVNYGDDTIRLERGDTLPEHAASLLKMTPGEAASEVESILKRVGLADSFGISDIYLVSDRYPLQGITEATGYGYRILCTRTVGQTLCAYLHDQHGSTNDDDYYWSYESIFFELHDSGVNSVSWTGPINVLETVSAAAQLRPFSEVLEIAQKILPMEFETEAKDETAQSVEVKIDRVTLSLQRVVEQGDPFSGLLVPVWNFYGSRTIAREEHQYSDDFRFGSMLSVNAIDGNIIDVSRGY